MGLSKSELQTELAEYKAARTAILSGAQQYSVGGNSLTRASLTNIEAKITELENRISVLTMGRKVSPVFQVSRS